MLPQNELLIIIFMICSILFIFKYKPSKHGRYIDTAKKIIIKIESMNDAQKMNYLKKINPYVFEETILCCFEIKGYKIERNSRYSGDGGIDGKVWFDGNLHLIQAKRYRGKIKKEHVLDFIRLVNKNKCRGFFIHTGQTTDEIRKIISSSPHVNLISGKKLIDLVTIKKNNKAA
ncbi:restriction endonuclease [Dickeya sp. NCPPB 3274]|uniref:restriction endonuclease n=1 Tax=Dickeya sp. NCPPB 3274 TaxID=568766 RepID=UPI0005B43919|nr:restriction endonuclease [Dickeya sp. NCPPB 3274]